MKFKLPDLSGKVVLITGATGGLGLASAKAFAQSNASVYVQGRSADKANAAVAEIKEKTGSKLVFPLVSDLARLATIRTMAESFSQRESKLNILMLNAGMGVTPFKLTNDGIEEQFQVNFLSHFLLVHYLKGAIAASSTRIVSLSSEAAENTGHPGPGVLKFTLDEINDEKSYDATLAYRNAKLAVVAFAFSLAEKYGNSAVIQPGIVNTSLQSKATGSGIRPWIVRNIAPYFGVPPEEGANTQLFASVSDVANGSAWRPSKKGAIPWEISFRLGPGEKEKLWNFAMSILTDKDLA